MKKKISFPLAMILVVVLGVLLLIIVLKCDFVSEIKIPLEDSMKTELSFSSVSCAELTQSYANAKTLDEGSLDSEPDPYDEETLGVKEINWLDKTTLEVKAFVSVNCAENVESGDYEIQGNKIVLKYVPSGCDPCAMCKCVNELNYKITGLTQKEYEFELKSE